MPMTVEIALVFMLVAGALYLFASERLPIDVTALVILVTVMGIPIVFHGEWLLSRGIDLQAAFPTIPEGLSGLSSPATVTVLCMFILSAGIQRSGLVHALGKRLFPLVGKSELRQLLMIALLIGPISGFINNTAAVAMAIPLVLDMVRRNGGQAARVLIPVSFFGMLGGTLTLVGTSTNLLASAILQDEPSFGRSIGMFEFFHLGLIVLGVGLVYFLTVGRWLIPKKDAKPVTGSDEELFVVELRVGKDSPLVGAPLADSAFIKRNPVEVLKVVRGDDSHVKRALTVELAAGDLLLVRADIRQVMDLIKAPEAEVMSDFGSERRVRGDGLIVSMLLRNRRLFAGKEAKAVNFWERYTARPVGLATPKINGRRLADEKLHVGEQVLAEVSASALQRLRRHADVVILSEETDKFDIRNMWLAGGIVALVVTVAAVFQVPIVITAVAGVIAMVMTGCVAKDDMYSSVSWDVIFLLAGVIPLGIAMTKSGGAAWLGGILAGNAAGWHPVLILMALYLVTTLLTELVSNNASVVILVPVAIAIGQELGLAPFPLVLAVMFAASTSFLTPIGYQTNTMIYGTGVYRFSDFARVGAPLNALLMVVTSFAIWKLWPL